MKFSNFLNRAEYPPHSMSARASLKNSASNPRQNFQTGVISSIEVDALSDGCARRWTIWRTGGTIIFSEDMRASSSPAAGIFKPSSAARLRIYSTSASTSSFLRSKTAHDFPLSGGLTSFTIL